MAFAPARCQRTHAMLFQPANSSAHAADARIRFLAGRAGRRAAESCYRRRGIRSSSGATRSQRGLKQKGPRELGLDQAPLCAGLSESTTSCTPYTATPQRYHSTASSDGVPASTAEDAKKRALLIEHPKRRHMTADRAENSRTAHTTLRPRKRRPRYSFNHLVTRSSSRTSHPAPLNKHVQFTIYTAFCTKTLL